MRNSHRSLTLALLAAAVTTFASAAQAQTVDPRWQAWLGCWRPNNEQLQLPADSGRTTLVCVVPGETPTSVALVNFAGASVISRGIVDANGVRRSRTVDQCNGFETAQWSSDNKRVMITSEFTCDTGVVRKDCGVMAMTPQGEWLQIQNVNVSGTSALYLGRLRESGVAIENVVDGTIVERPQLDVNGNLISPNRADCTGSESVTPIDNGARRSVQVHFVCEGVRRVASAVFERNAAGNWVRVDKQLPPFTTMTARLGAGSDVQPEAVIEMIKHVDVAAVEAWLTDRQQAFDLEGKDLVRMANNGVPSSVIDVLVALDNPQKFTLVARQAPRDTTTPRQVAPVVGGMGGYGSPYPDPWANPWDPYGFQWRYGYGNPYMYGTPYGYRYGYGYPYYGYGYPTDGGGPIIVVPRETRQRVQLVNGRGYTRAGGSPPSSDRGTVVHSSGSSASSSSARGTTTSGSSGSSTGRTAKARGGN